MRGRVEYKRKVGGRKRQKKRNVTELTEQSFQDKWKEMIYWLSVPLSPIFCILYLWNCSPSSGNDRWSVISHRTLKTTKERGWITVRRENHSILNNTISHQFLASRSPRSRPLLGSLPSDPLFPGDPHSTPSIAPSWPYSQCVGLQAA